MPVILEDIATMLARHPLMLEHFRNIQSHGSPKISTPRQVIGEKLLYTFALASGNVRLVESEREFTESETRAIVKEMLSSPSYLWEVEKWNLAISTKLPRHEVSARQLPFGSAWFSFENEMVFAEGSSLSRVHCVLLHQLSAHLAILHFGYAHFPPDGEEKMAILGYKIPIGEGNTYPDTYSESDREGVGMVLAALSFIRSPHIDKEDRNLNRQERRMIGPHLLSKSNNSVNFITLRRHYAAKAKHEQNPTGRHYDNWRWTVGPHNRNQWYPSTQEHKMIWISPYLKGPEDKPLKPKIYKVSR
jgi:hypothetical protein